MNALPFTKMHGIGNDFIILNNFVGDILHESYPKLALKLCDRHFGIGSDGIIILEKSKDYLYKMRMFNPDGTESGACGNGSRCFALYLKYKNYVQDDFFIVEGPVGPLEITYLENDHVKINMGYTSLNTEDIGIVDFDQPTFVNQPIKVHTDTFFATAVYTGNPHIVIFTEDITKIPLSTYGPILEFYPLFKNQANVHFAKVLSPTHIKMHTWEKGAGVTLACGSGACATAIAGFINQFCERKVKISTPGGSLDIDYLSNQTVCMSGPAELICEGDWYYQK